MTALDNVAPLVAASQSNPREIVIARSLPDQDEMYAAVAGRDTRYDGIFFTAVRSTGIFCRPGCPARTPKRENVEFYPSTREALAHGYRPCLRCTPMQPTGTTPAEIQELLARIDADPGCRIRDSELRAARLDPAVVRRWFKRHHGMTFQAYQRSRRLGRAIVELASGLPVSRVAFDAGYDSLSGFQEALRQITGRSATGSRTARVVRLSRVLTPLGPMLLGATEEGVCLLEFTDRRMLETQLKRIARWLDAAWVPGSTDASRQMERELEEYFAGARTDFSVALVTPGSEFQERVWEELRRIPFGTTRSYAEQARAIGSPAAVRAVARANGDNRIAIIIPCHRVIGSDGQLTGYGGGLWRKRWLLHHERALAEEGRFLRARAGGGD